jgi:predicted ArsR family transcriptional regulator
MGLEQPAAGRRAVLAALKRRGQASIAQLARDAGVTGEAVRQHLRSLAADGYVASGRRPAARRARGRPTASYRLTAAGEELFPKAYDALAAELLAAVDSSLGPRATRRVLSALAEARVREWAPRLRGKRLEERLESLRSVYAAGDPFMSVERSAEGLKLIERNCPFLSVASRQPVLCSLTVSVLSRLLDRKVVREERFQDGAGRCVFRVREEAAGRSGPVFRLEPER